MIYVTVGTMFMDFPRLINAMDDVARRSEEEVLIQTGMGATTPKYADHFDFKSREDVMAIQARARLIISHAGIGCVRDALASCKSLVVVPRLKRHGEHMNDHQLDLAQAIDARGWGRMVTDVTELPDVCANPPAPPTNYRPASAALINAVRRDIEALTGAQA